jgi:hypothetical protein
MDKVVKIKISNPLRTQAPTTTPVACQFTDKQMCLHWIVQKIMDFHDDLMLSSLPDSMTAESKGSTPLTPQPTTKHDLESVLSTSHSTLHFHKKHLNIILNFFPAFLTKTVHELLAFPSTSYC